MTIPQKGTLLSPYRVVIHPGGVGSIGVEEPFAVRGWGNLSYITEIPPGSTSRQIQMSFRLEF